MEELNDQDIVHQLFIFFNNHKDLIDILYKSNLQNIIVEQFLVTLKYDINDINIIAYSKSMIAYKIFGLCNEWYKRGMNESADEISALVKEFQKKQE